jgi:SagB-type dehydrogenase family enzyme
MPFRKELLSFALMLMIGLTTVLTVLFVQAKRENLAVMPAETVKLENAAPSPTLFPTSAPRTYSNPIALPKPSLKGSLSVEAALQTRRTKRTYTSESVKLADLSQMLWSGQGITVPGTEKRTAPSARESYPMTLFVAVKRVEGLQPGLYEYLPKTHSLGLMKAGDIDPALKEAGVQEGAQSAPVAVLISAAIGNYQAKTKSTTTTATYLEAGHIGQNMYLQAESIKLGMVVMAGFDSQKVAKALELGAGETVEYVVPMGYPAPEPVEE